MNNLPVERALISALFQYGMDAYISVCDIITKDVFTEPANLVVYKAIEHILKNDSNTKLDVPLVIAASKELGHGDYLEESEQHKFLRGLTIFPVELANARKFAGILKKAQVVRDLMGLVDQTSMDLRELTGEESIETILKTAENKVFDYAANLSASETIGKMIGEGLEEYIQYLEDNPVQQLGLPTGWPEFDKAIGGGLRRKTVTVLGARMKVGKSFSAINIGRNIAARGIPVWYGDTELDIKDHWHRLTASISRVPTEEIERGVFAQSPSKRQKVKEAAAILKALPYKYQCIAGKAFEETLGLMRRWVLQDVKQREDGEANDCLIIVDYLKLMNSAEVGRELKEYQVLGFMMTQLHNFAVKYGVPIFVLVQLNRDGIDSEDTDAVSGSDRIGWLCSSLALLKWQSQEEIAQQIGQEERYTHKLIIPVCRHGPGLSRGEFIHMKAQYQYGLLEEGPLSTRATDNAFEVDD